MPAARLYFQAPQHCIPAFANLSVAALNGGAVWAMLVPSTTALTVNASVANAAANIVSQSLTAGATTSKTDTGFIYSTPLAPPGGAAIPGLNIVSLPESMWCCGSAGIYNLIQPEMADKLLQRKVDHIAATGATLVATGNPGCLLQIQNGLRARGMKVEAVHPISLLAQAYRAR